MSDTPLFSIIIKRSNILLFGLHILFVVVAIGVFALLGLNLSLQFGEYYAPGMAGVIGLAVGALVALPVLWARVPVERAWTQALIRKELLNEPYRYTDVTFTRHGFTLRDHSGSELSGRPVKPGVKPGWFGGREQFDVFELKEVVRTR